VYAIPVHVGGKDRVDFCGRFQWFSQVPDQNIVKIFDKVFLSHLYAWKIFLESDTVI